MHTVSNSSLMKYWTVNLTSWRRYWARNLTVWYLSLHSFCQVTLPPSLRSHLSLRPLVTQLHHLQLTLLHSTLVSIYASSISLEAALPAGNFRNAINQFLPLTAQIKFWFNYLLVEILLQGMTDYINL